MEKKRDHEELDRLVERVKDVVFSVEIDPDATLAELGIDSVTVVDLLIACEEIYSVLIQTDRLQIDEFTSLRGLHSQLVAMPPSDVKAG